MASTNTETQDSVCSAFREQVVRYIKSSSGTRKAVNQREITLAFEHIYWCMNFDNRCGTLWRSLKFYKKYPLPGFEDLDKTIVDDPEIQKGIDKEIKALLARWENNPLPLRTFALVDKDETFPYDPDLPKN